MAATLHQTLLKQNCLKDLKPSRRSPKIGDPGIAAMRNPTEIIERPSITLYVRLPSSTTI